MEIKQAQYNKLSWFSKFKAAVLRRHKLKWLVFLVLAVIILTGFGLSCIYYGMILHKTGVAANMQEFLKGVYQEKLQIIPNYFEGILLSHPERLAIDVKFSDYQKLAQKRNEALQLGVLHSSSADFAPCQIRYKSETLSGKIRLKGDGNDHWIDKTHWSFRIALDSEKTIMGMNEFSIQLPRTRDNLNEWVLHKMFAYLGLTHIRYDFIDITFNGEHFGIYAVEEFFSKEILTNNQKPLGPILRFDETLLWYRELPEIDDEEVFSSAPIDAFSTNQISQNEQLTQQFNQAKNNLEMFRRGLLPASQVFDIEKMANFFAAIDLTGHHHATGFANIRFYFNPQASLIEPIGYDNQIMTSLTTEGVESERGIKQVAVITPIQYKSMNFQDIFFRDQEFFKAYVVALQKISSKNFLDGFFSSIGQEMNNKLRVLYRSYPGYKFEGKDILYQNQNYIKVILNPVQTIQAYYKNFNSQNNLLFLQIGNIQSLPVEVIDLAYKGQTFFKPQKPVFLQPKITRAPVDFQEVGFWLLDVGFSKETIGDWQVRYRILGENEIRTQDITPWAYLDNTTK